MAEDEMIGWYQRLNGHESEQAPGDGEGQGSLVCCGPRGHKELDTTEQMNRLMNTLDWLRNVEISGFSPLVPQLHRWFYREENCLL